MSTDDRSDGGQAAVTESPDMLDAMGMNAEADAARADRSGSSRGDENAASFESEVGGSSWEGEDATSFESEFGYDAGPIDALSQFGYDAGPIDELPDACIEDMPTVAADAVAGVHVWLQFDKSKYNETDETPASYRFGPGNAGPYKLNPHARDGELLFFVAYHTERQQKEWVVGPDAVWDFAATVDLYLGAAARLYPGSANVPGSQADGAEAVRDPESVVKQEAHDRAPWQVGLDKVLDGFDASNGGGALNFARNSRLRMNEYVKPARELAEQLAADLAAGKLDHLDARSQAVDGRNAILQNTRRRQSPAGRYMSKKLKEQGTTLEKMVDRKVRSNLAGYRTSDVTKQVLDGDSALWAKYAAAFEAGEDTLASAVRELGESPEVSKSIIRSAGNTNKWVTRIAKWFGPPALALGALGVADAYADIADAAEARNWHAAAGEFTGFLGGLVGGELGAMFLVSLVPGGVGFVLVASVIGGIGGSVVGSLGGKGLVDVLGDGGAYGGGLATGLGPAGGFAGLHSKDRLAGQKTTHHLATTILELTAELDTIASAIPQAHDRAELEALQRMRLDVLGRRQQLEDVLTAIRLGAFDEAEPIECEPEPEPSAPPPAPTEPDLCVSVDDDCDQEVD